MSAEPEIQELTRLAAELVQRIDTLVDGTGDRIVDLARVARRNRQMIVALALSILLDVVLTGLVIAGLKYTSDLAVKVNDSQQLARTEVLCPLYQQFINADTPAARRLAEKNGQDLKARDEAFRVIHHSYEVLGCSR